MTKRRTSETLTIEQPPVAKVAVTDMDFYYQLKQGGSSGWNDVYLDPADCASGKDRFYLKFYGVPMAQVELVTEGEQKKTAINVFGNPEDLPAQDAQVDSQQLREYQDSVIKALHTLRLNFIDR